MRGVQGWRSVAWLMALACCAAEVQAQETTDESSAAPAVDAKAEQARGLYREGVAAVRAARWSEALSAFERSAQLRPHATTTYNIAACEQAMGRYTKARETFARALEEGTSRPGELAPTLEAEARGYTEQIDKMLAHVTVTLVPGDAGIAVDGRPLASRPASSGVSMYVAGIELPGPGRKVSAATFELVVDSGPHVLTLSRKGYTDSVVTRSFTPGSRSTVKLEIARLPATLHVKSNVPDALVSVNGKDVGPVPVDVLRPAGTYTVLVTKNGYDPYEASIRANAGEAVNLRASMTEEQHPITKTWWFWTGAAAVVAGGAILTYALTRPEPEPPPYDGGSSGWVVHPQGVRF